MARRDVRWGRRAVIALPFLWLTLFFAAPFAIVLRLSLSDPARAVPPYTPVFEGLSKLGQFLSALDLETYGTLARDGLYFESGLISLRIAAMATLLTLLIAYPMALAIARAPRRWRGLLVALAILPFWTSFLIRVYALIAILKPEGLLNAALLALGIITAPLRILETESAILTGMVYAYLPFMVLPIYAALERQDGTLLEAAADLGCPPWKSFWTVTFPLSLPGVFAGCLLVFIPAVGEFVIPDLLGGPETLMIGKTLWTEFFSSRDWPTASAIAVAILVLLLVPIQMVRRLRERGAS